MWWLAVWPARSRRCRRRSDRREPERAGHDGSELVGADHRGPGRRLRMEPDDAVPCGANSASVLAAQERGLRQRTPSVNRIRRMWLRPDANALGPDRLGQRIQTPLRDGLLLFGGQVTVGLLSQPPRRSRSTRCTRPTRP
ncbi:hypothetical protein JOF55_003789 [Haloactinomyces albus]|uniref:Uncharacterized protein n=1 Tax=Haloactinomyces albus TaxID=1352928 RepID=A0AAE3ZHA5_9ACTN|nr:hypothetical protein [Haloactinomyces albus]